MTDSVLNMLWEQTIKHHDQHVVKDLFRLIVFWFGSILFLFVCAWFLFVSMVFDYVAHLFIVLLISLLALSCVNVLCVVVFRSFVLQCLHV